MNNNKQDSVKDKETHSVVVDLSEVLDSKTKKMFSEISNPSLTWDNNLDPEKAKISIFQWIYHSWTQSKELTNQFNSKKRVPVPLVMDLNANPEQPPPDVLLVEVRDLLTTDKDL